MASSISVTCRSEDDSMSQSLLFSTQIHEAVDGKSKMTSSSSTMDHSDTNNIPSTSTFSYMDEFKRLIIKAGPVSLSTLARLLLGTIDIAFVGNLQSKLTPENPHDYLASATLASTLITIMFVPIYGACTSLNTLCSQSLGAGKNEQVGEWLQIASFCLMFLVIPCIIMVSFTSGPLLSALNFSDDIIDNTVLFARVYACSTLFFAQYMAIRQYLQVLDVVWCVTVIDILSIGLDAAFNQFYMYGIPSLGWNGWGFVGSPIATVTTCFIQLIILYFYAFWWKQYHVLYYPKHAIIESFTITKLKVYSKLSMYLSIGMTLDSLLYEIVTIASGRLSAVVVSAQGVLFNIWGLSWAILWGVLLAGQTRIGYWIGAGNPDRQAQKCGRVCLLTIISVAGCIGCIIALTRNQIGTIFTSNQSILDCIADGAWILAISFIISSVVANFIAVFEGLALPEYLGPVMLIGGWCLLLPLAYTFCFVLDLGIQGIWIASICCETTKVVLLLLLLLFRVDWKQAAAEAQLRCHGQGLESDDGLDKALVSGVGEDEWEFESEHLSLAERIFSRQCSSGSGHVNVLS